MALTGSDLDLWLPDAQVRTHHRRESDAEPDALWAAARRVRLDDTGTIGALVRWRIPGVPAQQTFLELFANDPFTLLEEGEHYSISGLVGRIWTLERDYPPLDGPDAFRAWSRPRTVRVLFAHWIERRAGGGGCAIVSEARVAPTDTVAKLQLRALWLALGPFERLIGAEPLTLAVARAERG
jgi:hypothetical protein